MLFLCAIIAILGESRFTPITQNAQNFCNTLISDGIYIQWQQALICGASPKAAAMTTWHQLGISHLIVVSGAHLMFLEQLISKIFKIFGRKPSQKLVLLTLITYGFLAGLQPPVVRALFQKSFFPLKGLDVALSGVWAWIFFCELSPSLALSWSCALLISWPGLANQNALVKSALIHFGLMPVIAAFGAPTLWAVLINPIAIFCFGVVLFPITLLNLILPLQNLCDLFWSFFLNGVNQLAQAIEPHDPLPMIPLALYILGLQWLYLRAEIRAARERVWV